MKLMMNDEGLLECPFCGLVNSVVTAKDRPYFFVECLSCGANGASALSLDSANRLWNTRNGHLYTADDYKQDAEERRHGL